MRLPHARVRPDMHALAARRQQPARNVHQAPSALAGRRCPQHARVRRGCTVRRAQGLELASRALLRAISVVEGLQVLLFARAPREATVQQAPVRLRCIS